MRLSIFMKIIWSKRGILKIGKQKAGIVIAKTAFTRCCAKYRDQKRKIFAVHSYKTEKILNNNSKSEQKEGLYEFGFLQQRLRLSKRRILLPDRHGICEQQQGRRLLLLPEAVKSSSRFGAEKAGGTDLGPFHRLFHTINLSVA